MKNIYTIGHSNMDIEEFVKILMHYGIESLADIRSHPGSKRNKQFNRTNLENFLKDNSMEYIWIRELGGLRENGFEDYMKTEAFRSGIDLLIKSSEKSKTAMMCAERNWRNCHRSLVSNFLCEMGFKTIHVFDKSHFEIHNVLL